MPLVEDGLPDRQRFPVRRFGARVVSGDVEVHAEIVQIRGDGGMLAAVDLPVDLQRLAGRVDGFIEPALPLPQRARIAQGVGHRRVPVAEQAAPHRDGFRDDRIGPRQLVALDEHVGERAERVSHLGVIAAIQPAPQLQGARQVPFGVLPQPELPIDDPDDVQQLRLDRGLPGEIR
jgi:hypothetical protein